MPVRTARASSQHSRAEKSTSYVVVLTMCPVTRVTAETAAQLAAMSWARRLPPSSRAISPVTSTIAAPARALGSRSATSEPGASASISRAITGVSGGWSG